jgi:signal transduction histidine kinase
MNELICPWEDAVFGLFSSHAYPLLYYSHFVPVLIGWFLVGAVLVNNSKLLTARLLAILMGIASFWLIVDVASTATNRPEVVAFLWSSQVLFEPLLYASAFFLFYAFAFNRLPNFPTLLSLSILVAPLIALAPTALTVSGVYLDECNSIEGPIASYYSYFVEIVITLWLLIVAGWSIARAKDRSERTKLSLFTMGIVSFLILFASGNIIGSFTDDWVTAQYGLLGLPIFVGFLGYLIVRFHAFNMRVFAAEVLMAAVSAALISILFIRSTEHVRIVTALTLAPVLILGYLLVRNVRREIEQRERIEQQEKELEVINHQQENLIHFISHEVKGYLTESEAAFASITEGDHGAVPPSLRTMAEGALKNMRRGVATVMEILNAASIKRGSISYKMQDFDLKKTVAAAVEMLRENATARGLTLVSHLEEGEYIVCGDEEKLEKHVIRNLIDNAIRYTPQGEIEISLSRVGTMIRLMVKDGGVGISNEDMSRLFTEGGRGKDSLKVNVHSTGFGLYIAKSIVDAHAGTISAASPGVGKGSTFTLELPAKR